MSIKGVIFDFNGTLFWDTDFHNEAWDKYLKGLGMEISDRDKDLHFHGKSNRDIFNFLFKREFSAEELDKVVEEKEGIYRDICSKKGINLAPGVIGFLEFLKNNRIPFTIATSSGWNNVDFFFSHFQLFKWFDPEKVIYDNGSFKGKPAPDIFLLAASKIGTPIENCLIFED